MTSHFPNQLVLIYGYVVTGNPHQARCVIVSVSFQRPHFFSYSFLSSSVLLWFTVSYFIFVLFSIVSFILKSDIFYICILVFIVYVFSDFYWMVIYASLISLSSSLISFRLLLSLLIFLFVFSVNIPLHRALMCSYLRIPSQSHPSSNSYLDLLIAVTSATIPSINYSVYTN